MKKWIALLLCAVLALSLAACGSNTGDGDASTETGTDEETVNENVSDEESVTEDGNSEEAGAEDADSEDTDSEEGTEDLDAVPETDDPEAYLTVDASEAYDSGAFSFQATQSGTYRAVSVTVEGFSPADVGCDAEEVVWSFYVLNEPFDDAVRYLPQAYDSVLEGDGSFEVTQGQYVYCLCNINGFTADEMPEGQNELTLTMK